MERGGPRLGGLGLLALALVAGCGLGPATAGVAGPAGRVPVASGLFPGFGIGDDGQVPPDYYREAEGLTGPALLDALGGIVARHRDLGYDRARDILFGHIADPTDQDVVADLYTGETRPGIRDRRTAYERGFNTEHIWPQSLGAVGAAQADLHHLQPADVQINGHRGSHPYGEVVGKPIAVWPGVDGTSRLGRAQGGHPVFEPRARKRGDIARGLLYFYTCYAVGTGGGAPAPDLRNFRAELPYLVKWHRKDPVDAGERARNDEVFQVQGSRNPYVDRPEWVAAAGF